MAVPNFGDLVTTTYQKRRGKLADNVSQSNALLNELKRKGRTEVVTGGRTLVEELEYAEGNFQRYAGYDNLTLAEPDIFDAAEYTPVQAASAIVMSGRQMRMNRGKEQIIPWLSGKIRNAEKTMANNICNDIYSAGTLANQINGLQAIVAKAPTSGTVGGIDASAQTWWRNKYTTITSSADTIEAAMLSIWLQCVRGADKPDLILSDVNDFTYYHNALLPEKRYTSDRSANGTWQELMFNTAPVIYDGSTGILTKTMYFLNTDYLKFKVYSGANFELLDTRNSINQDASARFLIFMGNLTCSNRSLQGIVTET